MRSRIVGMGFIVLAGVVARDNRVSACSITDADTDKTDDQMFKCQGGKNPLPDPITGLFDQRPSIFFAPFGRGADHGIPDGCMTSMTILPTIPTPDCQNVPCPDPNVLQGTGLLQWSFFIQDHNRWHLDDNEWDAHGKNDTVYYDLNQPYSKMLNTAYLIWFGLKDSATSFHGTQDYVALSLANDGNFHDAYYRNMGAEDGNAQFNYYPFVDDEIETSCRLFSATGPSSNNVAFRAATILHESWHAWENRWVQLFSVGHRDGPDRNCMEDKDAICDFYFKHTTEAFRPFGTLYQGVSIISEECDATLPPAVCAKLIDKQRFHSPTQIAWEFLCDLMVFPADWVTNDIVMGVAPAAQTFRTNRLINGAPMQCMNNRPMTGS